MAKHGKKYREALEKIDRNQQYDPVEALELAKQRVLPEWMEAFQEDFRGVVKRMPERSEMPLDFNELLIVELYSK